MNFEQYIPLALRTASPLARNDQIEHAQIGIVTEVGELADAVKRNLAYGKDLDITNLVEEVGDVWWYVALLVRELEVKPRVIERMIEDAYDAPLDPSVSLSQHVRLMASLAGALASYRELGENPTLILSTLLPLLVHFLKRFDRLTHEALEANIEKLHNKSKGRYKDGEFSTEAALNRDTAAERELLEGAAGA